MAHLTKLLCLCMILIASLAAGNQRPNDRPSFRATFPDSHPDAKSILSTRDPNWNVSRIHGKDSGNRKFLGTFPAYSFQFYGQVSGWWKNINIYYFEPWNSLQHFVFSVQDCKVGACRPLEVLHSETCPQLRIAMADFEKIPVIGQWPDNIFDPKLDFFHGALDAPVIRTWQTTIVKGRDQNRAYQTDIWLETYSFLSTPQSSRIEHALTASKACPRQYINQPFNAND